MENPFSFKNKKFTWKSVVFLLLIAGFFVGPRLFHTERGLDDTLVQAANEINAHCPMMVDSVTRFNNAMAMTGNQFRLTYTLLNEERSKVDTNLLISIVKPKVINRMKTDPKAKLFLEKNVTVSIVYCDKAGAYLCDILIPPSLYKQ